MTRLGARSDHPPTARSYLDRLADTTGLGLSVPFVTAIVVLSTLGAGGDTYLLGAGSVTPGAAYAHALGRTPVEGTGTRDQDLD